ncbi:MAG TPA: SIS domain-containing protein [Chloroflexota bacterium]|jgi:D-sedoheptulose 7-phosphate isomerase|nr:SIS domain-containing protein [Chloroflexota bacterium]
MSAARNPSDIRGAISDYLTGLRDAIGNLALGDVEVVVEQLRRARMDGRQVFIAGNGGSAATASHMACDLAKNTLNGNSDEAIGRFRVVSLTDNVALITAWSNDAGYEFVFSQQLRNLARPGDLLVVISGSGNSPNILEAVRAARSIGLTTLGLLGFDGGKVRSLLDYSITVQSTNYGYIEDAHMVLAHAATDCFVKLVAAESASH